MHTQSRILSCSSLMGCWALLAPLAAPAIGCGVSPPEQAPAASAPSAASGARSFGDDLQFLRQHTQVVLLQDPSGRARVIVAPEYQGRVMTSTAAGDEGLSFGYIHRAVVAQKSRAPHMNVFGGEDRFWLGPEGGQYGLYFPPGAPFDLTNWQTPEPIDWGGWPVVSQSASEVRFSKDMQVQNHSGTVFRLRVDRAVRVLDRAALERALGGSVPAGVELVGYESDNTLNNTGMDAWTKPAGLLSIWILGMFNPTAETTMVIPFEPGSETQRGPIVNDAYFGKVPADRLVVGDGALYFRGDGKARGKIGIPRPRARPIAGAYDAAGKILTLVQYTLPEAATDYVNSMWETQQNPYGGDVVNAYNDGPLGPGKPPLGPFYELETSSPGAALAPGQSLQHVHRTLHLIGPRAELDQIAQRMLGQSLDTIEAAL